MTCPDPTLPNNNDSLSSIIAIQQEIATADLHLPSVMHLIAERAQQLTHASGAVIELVEGDELVYRAATGSAAPSVGLRLKSATSFSGLCVRTREVMRCDDAQIDPRVNREACQRVGLRSMIVVPLYHQRQVVGVLKVLSSEVQAFDETHCQVLQLMAGLLAAAMSRAAAFEAEQALTAERGRALSETEERFRCAFEDTNVAMVLTDMDNRFIRLNAAFAKMFGYSQDEMLQLSMADITHPDDVAESLAQRENLLAGGKQFFQLEKRYLHKDGRILWGLTNVSLVRDRNGQPVMYVGQLQDITERKRAAEANARYIERLRILHEIDRALIAGEGPAAIAAAALAPLRELLGVPRAIVNLFDLAKGEVEWLAAAGRRRIHVGPGVRYSIRLMGDLDGLRRGEPQLIDVHALPPGPDVDALLASGVHAYMVVPMIAQGELIGALSFGGETAQFSPEQMMTAQEAATQFALAIAQARLHECVKRQAHDLEVEVNERKQANQALQESEARYRLLFAGNPQPMWVYDLETLAFLHVNDMACRHYGYSNAEFLAMTISDIRPTAAVSFSPNPGLEQSGVWKHRKKDGKVIDVETTSHDFFVDGRAARLVLANDITERKRLEEQFRQAQKMEAVGRLAGGVAHDFNNLLTIIMGYSEIALGKLQPEDMLHGLVDEIQKAGRRAEMLTRQLLAFSRKQVLLPVVLNLTTLLTDMEKMLRRLIGEDVELKRTAGSDLWPVKADPGQMEQIIMNLAVNARDAMPQGGKLTIETANVVLDEQYASQHAGVRQGDYVLLAVTDTGCGMDEATKCRIFEPFFTTKGEKGTGLGLATVFGIVKQSNGTIEVYSEAGLGTSFKVYLPKEQVEGSESKARPTSSAPLRGTETILLAEDDTGVRNLAAGILRNQGYKVIEACNGREALLVVEQSPEPIQLLVSDVVMPQMGGRQLVEQVLLLQPALKVLYLSGYTDDAIVHHGVLDSGTPFLHKPFSVEGLSQKVREVLDR
jgi:hypothetical protein